MMSGPEMSLIISPVDSGELLSNLLSKAEWILANLVLSPVDSGEMFYQAG